MNRRSFFRWFGGAAAATAATAVVASSSAKPPTENLLEISGINESALGEVNKARPDLFIDMSSLPRKEEWRKAVHDLMKRTSEGEWAIGPPASDPLGS